MIQIKQNLCHLFFIDRYIHKSLQQQICHLHRIRLTNIVIPIGDNKLLRQIKLKFFYRTKISNFYLHTALFTFIYALNMSTLHAPAVRCILSAHRAVYGRSLAFRHSAEVPAISNTMLEKMQWSHGWRLCIACVPCHISPQNV